MHGRADKELFQQLYIRKALIAGRPSVHSNEDRLLPRVMDLEHFMESFLALRSNQEPRFELGFFFVDVTTPDRLENVFDFWSILMSMVARLRIRTAQLFIPALSTRLRVISSDTYSV